MSKDNLSKSEDKVCAKCNKSFHIDASDFTFYAKIDVPAPTLCSGCRLQRRLLFRNDRTFYKRDCDLCGKNIVSMYDGDFKTPVYCVKCWWSDNWDPIEYGFDYDPLRSFIEQFNDLFYAVPVIAMMNDDGIASVNCPYTCDFAFGKNAYLVTATWEVENGMYSYHVCQCKDIIDSYYSNHCALSYELVSSHECYGCKYCTLCVSCSDCILGYDLRGCNDCIMSVGIRNKQYCILNEQYTKEEYEIKKKEMQLDNREKFEEYKKQFEKFALGFPRRFAHMFKSVGSSGNVLFNCKMAKDSYYFKNLEECRYFVVGDTGKDSYDCTNTGKVNMCYEGITPDNSYRNIATIYCWKCNQAEYSNNCHGSNSVLGCSGLKHSEFMILNKKYTKDEFIKLRSQILEDMKKRNEWGEFFQSSMSPFAYNETATVDWFPLTEQQASEQGFRWRKSQEKQYDITLKFGDVPLTISEVTDDILKQIIGCKHRGDCNEKCTVAFRITPQELQLYRRMSIPIPQLCHNCRYYQRLDRRNLAKLYDRKCQCAGEKSDNEVYKNTNQYHASHKNNEHCPNEFETSFAPERPDIVYCEVCYQSEIA